MEHNLLEKENLKENGILDLTTRKDIEEEIWTISSNSNSNLCKRKQEHSNFNNLVQKKQKTKNTNQTLKKSSTGNLIQISKIPVPIIDLSILEDNEQKESTLNLPSCDIEIKNELNIEGKKEENDNEENKEEQEENLKHLPSYYLTNFWLIINSVLKESQHLFLSSELEMITKLSELDELSQRLFIRLFLRKRQWFRAALLKYREIQDILSSCKCLEENRFIEMLWTVDSVTLPLVLSFLSIKELKILISQIRVKLSSQILSLGREKLEELILLQKNQRTLQGEFLVCSLTHKILGGPCLRLNQEFTLLLERVQHLFFLNNYQDQSLLLLVDMKKVQFPLYKCQKQHPIFSSREEFLNYETTLQLETFFYSSLTQSSCGSDSIPYRIICSCIQWLLQVIHFDKDPFQILQSNGIQKDWEKLKPKTFWDDTLSSTLFKSCFETISSSTQVQQSIQEKPYLARFSQGWIFARIVNDSISIFEKEKQYDWAFICLRILLSSSFSPGKRIKWWTRLAIDLKQTKRKV